MSNVLNRAFLVLYSLLFFVTPLLMFHKTSELFEFNKMLFIYLITLLITFFWITKMIIYKKIIVRRTFLDLPLMLFLASQIISAFLSIDRHTSVFGYYGRFNGGLLSIISYIILYFAFVSNLEKDALPKLLITSLASSFLVILWGLPGRFGYDLTCLLFTGSLSNDCWTEQFRPAERMFSTLGQPNWLASYLAVNFFLSIYFYLKDKNRRNLFFISCFLFLNFTAILFTRSRSAYLAVAIPFTGLFIYIYKKKPALIKKLYPIIILFALSILIFKTGIPKIDKFLSFPNSKSSIQRPTSNLNNDVTESFDIRKIVWRGGLELGARYPIFGTGVETFAYAYYFVRPAVHNTTSEWDFIYNKAHNEFINYFATTGLTGVVSYTVLIASVFILAFKTYKSVREYEKRFLIISLIAAYTTILLTNFFGFSTTTINIFFYLIPAVIVVSVSRQKGIFHVKKLKLKKNQKIIFIIPCVFLIVGIYFITGYFLADINYANADNYLKIADYEKARIYFKKALNFRQEHVYYDKLSQTDASMAFIKSFEKQDPQNPVQDLIAEAEYYNVKSINSSPKNVIYTKTRAKNFYIFYQILSDDMYAQAADGAFRQAVKLAPTDPKIYYSWALFTFSKYENKKDKAFSTQALVYTDTAIKLKNDYRDAYFLKGEILKKTGKSKESRAIFKYILDNINPQDEEAQRELD